MYSHQQTMKAWNFLPAQQCKVSSNWQSLLTGLGSGPVDTMVTGWQHYLATAYSCLGNCSASGFISNSPEFSRTPRNVLIRPSNRFALRDGTTKAKYRTVATLRGHDQHWGWAARKTITKRWIVVKTVRACTLGQFLGISAALWLLAASLRITWLSFRVKEGLSDCWGNSSDELSGPGQDFTSWTKNRTIFSIKMPPKSNRFLVHLGAKPVR